MNSLIQRLLPVLDVFIAVLLVPAALLMKAIRVAGIHRLPVCKRVLLKVGIFPIRDHYYEPQFNFATLTQPLTAARDLPGIAWNPREQVAVLESFSFADELRELPLDKASQLEFYLNNSSFSAGDAEFWYQLIRQRKPRRIFEIGSGNSTLMARRAIAKNASEDPGYQCKHVCIEPYEMPWLEQTGVIVLRQKVEEVDFGFFAELDENDVLFIDSSHVIRPQGDVVFEYLEILPRLRKGVIVHVHDIRTPANYPVKWVIDEVRFWDEQYLLEAFLSDTDRWTILGALNYLHHHHPDAMKRVAPFLKPESEPGSFYIQRTV